MLMLSSYKKYWYIAKQLNQRVVCLVFVVFLFLAVIVLFDLNTLSFPFPVWEENRPPVNSLLLSLMVLYYTYRDARLV